MTTPTGHSTHCHTPPPVRLWPLASACNQAVKCTIENQPHTLTKIPLVARSRGAPERQMSNSNGASMWICLPTKARGLALMRSAWLLTTTSAGLCSVSLVMQRTQAPSKGLCLHRFQGRVLSPRENREVFPTCRITKLILACGPSPAVSVPPLHPSRKPYLGLPGASGKRGFKAHLVPSRSLHLRTADRWVPGAPLDSQPSPLDEFQTMLKAPIFINKVDGS